MLLNQNKPQVSKTQIKNYKFILSYFSIMWVLNTTLIYKPNSFSNVKQKIFTENH